MMPRLAQSAQPVLKPQHRAAFPGGCPWRFLDARIRSRFLDQIIDYAGLFPPAKLPLEEALPRYLHYRKESPHRWMLGRFVCPTAKLPELLAIAQGHPDRDLLWVAALGQVCTQVSEVYGRFDEDQRAIEDFRRAWGQESVIDIYEVALPKEKPAAAVRNVSNLIAKCWHAAFGRNAVREVTDVTDRIANCWTFLEPPGTPAWRRDLQGLFSEISDLRENRNFATSVGVKLSLRRFDGRRLSKR